MSDLELEIVKLTVGLESLAKRLESLEQHKEELEERFNPIIKVKWTSEEAKKLGLPFYAKKGDAGFDLRVVLPKSMHKDGITIHPGDRILLSAGFKLGFPKGVWGRITHRSSTENKLRIRVIEGTIDEPYRGEIFAQIHNPNSYPITRQHGDRLAQMILQLTVTAKEFVEVEELDKTDRNDAGFGSTGV